VDPNGWILSDPKLCGNWQIIEGTQIYPRGTKPRATSGAGVVEKEELINRVWPDSYGEGSLTRNIPVLRKTLGEDVYRIVPVVEQTTSNPVVVPPEPLKRGGRTLGDPNSRSELLL